jgi:hypothetical protein
VQPLDGRSNARQQPAAADRHVHVGRVRQLVDDLQPERALPRDDPRMVEWRHHRQAPLVAEALGLAFAFGGRRAREEHLRAIPPRPVDLHSRGGGGHHDDCRRAELCRRTGQGLSVVARRIGDDSAAQLVRPELSHHVGGAADLEGASDLEVLALEPQPGAPHALGGGQERRSAHYCPDPLGGLPNLFERDEVGCINYSHGLS